MMSSSGDIIKIGESVSAIVLILFAVDRVGRLPPASTREEKIL